MKKDVSAWKSRYPLLHQFFRGYLHQDFPEEYGSIAGALRQYRAGSGEEEYERYSDEWDTSRGGVEGQGRADVEGILSGNLGGGWDAASARGPVRSTAAVAHI